MSEIAPLIIPAFIAGVFTFLAPCTLPLVPAYLVFISGISLDEILNEDKKKTIRRKIFLHAIFYVFGFSIVFILFGMFAGLAGQALSPLRLWISRLGGIVVIFFGLFLLRIFPIPFLRVQKRFSVPKFLKIGKLSTSFFVGVIFAFGWSPCIGPVLGSILLLAATSSSILQGGFLLMIYSLGLALPFLITAYSAGVAVSLIRKTERFLKFISLIGGIFLVFLGILLLTGNFQLLIIWGYRLFGFIGYEKIINYL